MRERIAHEHEALLPATQDLLHEVEAETGRLVEIRPDARVKDRGRAVYVATDPDPERHLILYDPDQAHHLDHLVAHECGHIVRFARARSFERRLPVLTAERRAAIARELLPGLGRLVNSGVPEGAIRDVLPMWLGGTIAQLADVPSDIRIERWIWKRYPALRQKQSLSLMEQADALALGLRPVVAAFTPDRIWHSSNAMSYTLVKAVSRLLSRPELTRPYRGTAAQGVGEELLAMVDVTPDEGLAGDRALSERWAEHLGILDWLEWRTLDSLPAGFRRVWE